ncbi:mechanosensitive ion channel family protein [Microlunatus soli]|uniref:Cyclic nucleotide-binding domain-containing protein n=1 Tax=Microlunatus soli TaxID=630515 RepID=A0A1H1RWH4_9ACTN|nr:mechanosensitive ion channel family protein [Microlunatus soli]SDS39916.1 Cyclic nucleotide-binding domain-containing protein [Microlunatus soli]
MITVSQQPWFWPVLAIVIGLPVLLLILTEIGTHLDRRQHAAGRIVRLVRNYVLPAGALLLLIDQVTRSVGSDDFTWTKIISTVFGFLVILAVLNSFNLVLFTNAEEGSWRKRIPSIFVDIARIVLIIAGLAVLFSTVWGANVAGLFTALGVTSVVIGLALQGAVGSIVSGLLLLFEQPFQLGDWLDTGGVRGRVVEVNWRAVHIDTGNGIQIVPNASLAGAAFTNLSRGGDYTVSAEVTFTTDDPPAQVVAMLRRIALGLPELVPDTMPTAVPIGGADYRLSFDIRGPSEEGAAVARLRTWLWYAARRQGLGLDGDTTDDYATAENTAAAVASVAPALRISSDRAREVLTGAQLERYAAGETVLRIGEVPDALRFVLRGRVRLGIPLPAGGQRPVSTVETGDYLGQTALTHEPLPSTAVAMTELAVLVLPVTDLDQVIGSQPQFARDLSDVIDRRRDEALQAEAQTTT